MANYIPKIFKPVTDEDYLTSAVEVANWIDSLSIPTEGGKGKIWQGFPEGQDGYGRDIPMFTEKCIYSGSSGIGIFLIRLYEATGDKKYLDEAEKAAHHILETKVGAEWYKKTLSGPVGGIIPVPGWAIGWSNGPVGEAFFMEDLYEITGKQEYRDFVTHTADVLLEVAIKTDKGIHWSDEEDMCADGGFITFLELVYRRTGDKKYLDAAKSAGDYIALDALDSPHGGKFWRLLDLSLIDFAKDTTFPNFAHGTSGTAWMFLNLYRDTSDEKYLELAKQGAEYLMNIAVGDERGILIPYQDHPVTGLTYENYYLSDCHGPVGSTLIFRELYNVTGDKKYLDFAVNLSRGIIRAGAPEKNSWGYWNCHCICCGTAGILEHFVDMYEYTGQSEFLEYAERTAKIMLSKSDDRVANVRRWNDCWWRTNPNRIVSYTGLYVGSAGMAATLLRLYAAKKGKKLTKLFTYKFLEPKRN